MNVIQCKNGHYFDNDKYSACPHCSSVAVTGNSRQVEALNRSSGRNAEVTRKEKNPFPNVKHNREKKGDKTFGLFSFDNLPKSSERKNSEAARKQDYSDAMPILCPSCFKQIPADSFTCPYCGAKTGSLSGPNSGLDFNLNLTGFEKAPVEDSLFSSDIQFIESNKQSGTDNSGFFSQKSSSFIPTTSASDFPFDVHQQVGTQVDKEEQQKPSTLIDTDKTVGFFSANVGSTEKMPKVSTEPVVGWLVGIKGEHFGESFNISSGRNSVGRSASNSIVMAKDFTVSREKQAWIIYEPKKREFYIQPGEGSSLSYLNGEMIMTLQKLKNGDVIDLGSGQYMLIPLCGENFTWEDYIN